MPSSNPLGSSKTSDFQHKSRHATTIKNRNYAAQRLHQKITFAKQKQNETSESAEGEIIEVETYKLLDGRSKKRMLWVKNCLYQLTCDERDILISENEWLTDNLILASHKILREQSSISGFQDPIKGEKMALSIMKENFIQILHDGYGHWFTVSTIGAQASYEVFIYDSMLCSLGGHGRKQVAALLACPEKEISIKMMKVQQQEGKNDCGLFAIAFATALANGVQPGHCVFKQSEMRKHLIRSLEEKVLSMFPVEKMKRGRVGVHCINSIEIFCSCRMPIDD